MGTLSGKTLVVGAGGVSHAAVHKMAMNSDIFSPDFIGFGVFRVDFLFVFSAGVRKVSCVAHVRNRKCAQSDDGGYRLAMYIRTKPVGATGRTRVQIVKSIRTGAKVSQKIIRHVGIAHDGAELQEMKRLALLILEKLRTDYSPQGELFSPEELADLSMLVHKAPRPDRLGVDLGDCREESRLSLGLRNVMGEVYSGFGWNSLLGPGRKKSNTILRELVLARLSQPESKRATVEALANRVGITLSLNQVYQTMDYLDDETIEHLCRMSHEAAEKLLDGSVDVLFYDCTTLAFDTEREDAEEAPDRLLAKGYSKDGKHQRSQVMLALMVTADGLPVGYELFAGNTWEGHTLEEAIKSIEERFEINKVTVVADAAMLSKDNRNMLSDKGLPYILGYRMKSAPTVLKARILSQQGSQPWAGHGADDKTEEGWYKVIEHEGSRIIVTWSPARARNDAHKRDKAMEKLRKKFKQSRKPANFSSRGYARFLSFPDAGDVQIDEDKIKDAAKWDGLHAILVHGADDLTPQDAIARYHQLWQIEACFRTNKHDLKIRPVYHWTPRRVRAHIAICYMAFCCLQHLRKRLEMLGHPMSPARIRRELDALQISILYHKGTQNRYAMPSPITADAKRILNCVGLTWDEAPFQMPPEKARKRP